MRSKFREFYFESSNDEIWNQSLIVLDTNVLLNLYRYSNETTNQILNLLKSYKQNLWLPHQVALEYHYNRKKVIMEQKDSHKKVIKAFKKIPDDIRNILNQELKDFKKRHKEDIESFITHLEKNLSEPLEALDNRVKDQPDLLKEDYIKERLTDLLSNRIGDPFEQDKLKMLEKEAETRFGANIPPGYKDFKKKNDIKFFNQMIIQDKYGDYILWKQILEYAKEKGKSVIFLTDEQKEDWWYKSDGQIIGPRIELLNEFSYITKKEFYMFSSIGFIERNGHIVDKKAALEVREVNEEYIKRLTLKPAEYLKKFYNNLAETPMIKIAISFEKNINKEDVENLLVGYFGDSLDVIDLQKERALENSYFMFYKIYLTEPIIMTREDMVEEIIEYCSFSDVHIDIIHLSF
ncbi:MULTISPECIES: PIN-like domain-containing protein [Bacillus amyloliquefaciens group]|uniref:PIN-like domain-containing protein n=1 Tax=Bacillus amyloliquefaciens group TaxID=1938374 RepID=UPI000849C41A|nr:MULTISPECIES: PIN domain-containing protein [Bacillus amyloliquefaciens group]MBI0441937.1 hypothetical protein [Bacillus velezensis]NIH01635.1 hypothetical protein [Bacillus amyloliquefaciens]NIH01685.1 hypothetical protein [Bacillus amyloliquefaciens]PAE75402.1 hypothetical protein CHH82_13145 [Bacillus velezensis]WES02077.1 PIN domain-containing protein [Bacillus velezensis]